MTQIRKPFSAYEYGEGRTTLGQVVEFTCPPDRTAEVQEFLRTTIGSIDTCTTKTVISHGGYGKYSRYNMTQHDYAGGGPGESGGWGYSEVLEIINPPDGRCGIVFHQCTSHGGSAFSEWETLDDALKVFKTNWQERNTVEQLSKHTGFKRHVLCGALTPWFYAIGDEQLIDDYAFPEGLQNDPVYHFGRKFVVFDEAGIPSVRTCMGTLLHTYKQSNPPYREQQYRVVYWDDGTIWDESGINPWWSNEYRKPRPLEEGELWITEAIEQFHRLLGGANTEFHINFTDGSKFVGKRVRPKKARTPCAEGDYSLIVQLKGERKPQTGMINEFKPTAEAPDIIQYVTRRYADRGRVVLRIEIKRSKTKPGGRKWAGVFYNNPQ